MFGLGFQEILFILLVVLLIFGAAKLPEIGRALGKSLNEFKKGMSGSKEEDEKKEDLDKK
ncbi:MAG: twin-arginine translocase TatA/TatE family subunit [Candidatus Aureabacteria bacterium]|nr:twin-arginine translocase TatA/TatE family subunit [Candidatus Auribacterota bacterium]